MEEFIKISTGETVYLAPAPEFCSESVERILASAVN